MEYNVLYAHNFLQTLMTIQPDPKKLRLEDLLTVFAAVPPLFEKKEKCVITAEVFRNEGNIIFKAGSYEGAAKLYTRSLQEAPPYSKCAALAYANRSAALYRLEEYEDCILDVEKALDLPYPDDLREKIILRKEAALHKLNKSKNQTNKDQPIDNLKYAHGSNPKLPGASNGIDIAHCPRAGRKLIAKMPLQAGDVLIVQDPFLPVINLNEDKLEHCHYCLKKSGRLDPCDLCNHEVYCSDKCRTEAYENYHRIECKIQNVMSGISKGTSAILCVLRWFNVLTEQGSNIEALRDDLREIEENSDLVNLGFTGEQFIGNSRKAFLSLLHGNKINESFEILVEVAYIVTLLRNYTNFFKTNADVPRAARLLLKLRTAYDLNNFPILYFGSCLIKVRCTYPLLSLARHACVNNTVTYHNNNGKIVLRASQDIKPGEQILFNYLDLKFDVNDIVTDSPRSLDCTRHCYKCCTTFVYPRESYRPIKLNKKLRIMLQKNPFDIEALWKLLNFVNGKCKTYSLHAQFVKVLIVEAYEGRHDPEGRSEIYRFTGVGAKI